MPLVALTVLPDSCGDILTSDGTTRVVLPVGTDGQILSVDADATPCLAWTDPTGGTVTSVDVSGGATGLTTSGGPIVGVGTITLAGTLDADNGGTGLATYTTGDLIYASGSTALAKLGVSTDGKVLTLA